MGGRGGDWEGVQLHIVTGKGGTGKTTVAAALALALAAAGRRILVCEVEGRQGLARLFDVPALPYSEQRLATVPRRGGSHGEVHGLAVDPAAALMEYLDMYYRLGRAGRALEKIGAVDFVTTVAPGLRDVLLTGKVYEAAHRADSRRGRNRPIYDAVIMDAPPTGRIARFLEVNSGVADLARVGPIRHQADAIMSFIRSPRTLVHLVTVLEEMAVQETADGTRELRDAGIPVGGVVVNFVRRAPLERHALANAAAEDSGHLAAALLAVGLPADDATVAGLRTEAHEYATRLALEAGQRAAVEQLGRPTYELPRLADGVDLAGLHALGRELAEQGMA